MNTSLKDILINIQSEYELPDDVVLPVIKKYFFYLFLDLIRNSSLN